MYQWCYVILWNFNLGIPLCCIYYKVVFDHHQHNYLLRFMMSYTATRFDHQVVIFWPLKYTKLKLHLQLHFCMVRLISPSLSVTIYMSIRNVKTNKISRLSGWQNSAPSQWQHYFAIKLLNIYFIGFHILYWLAEEMTKK